MHFDVVAARAAVAATVAGYGEAPNLRSAGGHSCGATVTAASARAAAAAATTPTAVAAATTVDAPSFADFDSAVASGGQNGGGGNSGGNGGISMDDARAYGVLPDYAALHLDSLVATACAAATYDLCSNALRL